jgi:hypothetical protein
MRCNIFGYAITAHYDTRAHYHTCTIERFDATGKTTHKLTRTAIVHERAVGNAIEAMRKARKAGLKEVV